VADKKEPSKPKTGAQQLEDLWRLSTMVLRPSPIVYYKGRRAGGGMAGKFNLNVQPEYNEAGFIKELKGGLFLDLAEQGENNAAGHPTFKWAERETLITAKFGIPDIVALLAAMRDFRVRGVDVATYLRGKANKPNQVSLFHQVSKTDTTVITYTFEPERSILNVSKARDRQRALVLNLGEEIALQAYLEMSLDILMRYGGAK
jgi:hypothetical protein